MEKSVSALKTQLQISAGYSPCDLLLVNLLLVDVYTDEIRPSAVAIANGKIVAIDAPLDFPAMQCVDCQGRFAVPGFFDTHVHIETTLLTPEALGAVIAPWGTTSLCVDAMEIANVAGVAGLKELIRDTDDLPYRIFLEIPSRVPTAPGLETAGAVIGVHETCELLELEQTVSLGELDPSKILGMRDEYLQKVLDAIEKGKICNGHAIGLDAAELNIYATAHLTDDHESVHIEELIQRLRVGICPLIREGSSERNTEELIRGVLKHNLPIENLMFCTDDKHVNDIVAEGHISTNIQKAIDLGMNPIDAIKIATINAAKHFRLEHILGSITPGRYADIVLLDSLDTICPQMVLKSGVVISENGKAAAPHTKIYPPELLNTVHLAENFSQDLFRIPADGKKARCRVIKLIPDQIINHETFAWLDIHENSIYTDLERDILKLSIVERHGKNGRVSNALVQGFGLKTGALASSVSHDHHNIVVVGTNDSDMALAVREIEKMKGGFAAFANGECVGILPLPLAGLMSLLPVEDVLEKMNRLNTAVAQLGCTMNAPFMTLSFISLPTVPDLGLTDFGLIHVKEHRITELIVETKDTI